LNSIDLHTHTTESDGTFTPEELIQAASEAGLRTLAITDHDTFAGYEAAAALAPDLDLIRGIELTTTHAGKNVHLLGYFFKGSPTSGFEAWVEALLEKRRERNHRLARRLQDLGLDVHLEEAEKYGRRLTGRPHFARVMIAKGYVETVREAFDRYIGESGDAYVERESPEIGRAIERVTGAGGVTSLAHPIRLNTRTTSEEELIAGFASAGLAAIEVFHSDHTEADSQRYLAIAEKYGLAVTGGSDFHGAYKPGIELGRGINGNLRIPEWVVPALRARSR
jgi:predicted metal-dependent phosphoesterase TrpH